MKGDIKVCGQHRIKNAMEPPSPYSSSCCEGGMLTKIVPLAKTTSLFSLSHSLSLPLASVGIELSESHHPHANSLLGSRLLCQCR